MYSTNYGAAELFFSIHPVAVRIWILTTKGSSKIEGLNICMPSIYVVNVPKIDADSKLSW